jgi:hypothetical protein
VYIEMDDTDRALQLCEEAIALGRSQRASYDTIAKLFHRIAAAHTKRGDVPAALETYKKAQLESFDKVSQPAS